MTPVTNFLAEPPLAARPQRLPLVEKLILSTGISAAIWFAAAGPILDLAFPVRLTPDQFQQLTRDLVGLVIPAISGSRSLGFSNTRPVSLEILAGIVGAVIAAGLWLAIFSPGWSFVSVFAFVGGVVLAGWAARGKARADG